MASGRPFHEDSDPAGAALVKVLRATVANIDVGLGKERCALDVDWRGPPGPSRQISAVERDWRMLRCFLKEVLLEMAAAGERA